MTSFRVAYTRDLAGYKQSDDLFSGTQSSFRSAYAHVEEISANPVYKEVDHGSRVLTHSLYWPGDTFLCWANTSITSASFVSRKSWFSVWRNQADGIAPPKPFLVLSEERSIDVPPF